MKIGDRISVSMAGFEVTEAIIEDIDDGKATIFIPATRVVMGVATSLTDLPDEGTDRVILGNQHEESGPSVAVEQHNSKDDVGEGIRGAKLDSSAID